jgi:hypothetical protein
MIAPPDSLLLLQPKSSTSNDFMMVARDRAMPLDGTGKC